MSINSFLDRLFAKPEPEWKPRLELDVNPSFSFVDKLSASYLKKGTKVKSVLNHRGTPVMWNGYISMVEEDYFEVRAIIKDDSDEDTEILVLCLQKESIESGEYVIIFQLDL